MDKSFLTLWPRFSYYKMRGLGFQSVFPRGAVRLGMRVERSAEKEAAPEQLWFMASGAKIFLCIKDLAIKDV